jgi:hypothetical protein
LISFYEYGFLGKGEDLEQSAVKDNQILFDEPISGKDVVVQSKTRELTDFVIAVVGKAVPVRCQGQEQI